MSIGSILSVAQNYPSVMQPAPASATANASGPSAAQPGGSFQQALSSVGGSAPSAATSQASGATSAAKPHHGGGRHHGGGSSSSASQASTLLSTLSSLAGPSLDISV